MQEACGTAKHACCALVQGKLYNWKVQQKKAQLGPKSQAEALISELNEMESEYETGIKPRRNESSDVLFSFRFETLGEQMRRLINCIAMAEKDALSIGCQRNMSEARKFAKIASDLYEEFIKQ